MKESVSERCTLCGRKFDEVVHRFDSSAYCTTCVLYESEGAKRSREYDRTQVNRIHGRY